MSSGKVHTKASLILSIGFFIGAVITWDFSGIYYATGSFVGILIQPDCDVDSGHIADKHIRKKIGKWAEVIWDLTWHFYRKSVKHGSELSHCPIVSTVGRILYLYCGVIVVPHVLYYFVFHPQWNLWYVLEWYMRLIVENYRIVLGLMGADTIHFFLDILTKENMEKKKTKSHIIGGNFVRTTN